MKNSRTKIIFLGTGTPNPDPEHLGASLVILVDEKPYLVDFGAGLVRQAARLTRRYGGAYPALEARNFKTAFLTHLHSDHTVGYADLILTPWVMERDAPLEVYGPEGTKKMTEHILKAYEDDIHYRLYGLEPANNQGWRVNAREIAEGLIYKDELVKVEAFLVKHGTWHNAFGFRFTTPDKVIVISGDTMPCDNILKYAKDADVLIHEVYSQAGFEKKDSFWKNYHAINHTSTIQLAEIAKQTRPELLILYHVLYWGHTDQDILAEIAHRYDGKTIVSKDLMVIE